MTEAPLEITILDSEDRELLAGAAELYCKHLDKLATAAEDMGRLEEAAKYREEAITHREELVEPVNEGQEVVFYARHMQALEKGSLFLAHNMIAHRGGLRPFRIFGNEIERLEKCAAHAKNVLSVAFTPIMTGQAAAGEPGEKEDRDCPACGKPFTTAIDAPSDQECLRCLMKRG